MRDTSSRFSPYSMDELAQILFFLVLFPDRLFLLRRKRRRGQSCIYQRGWLGRSSC